MITIIFWLFALLSGGFVWLQLGQQPALPFPHAGVLEEPAELAADRLHGGHLRLGEGRVAGAAELGSRRRVGRPPARRRWREGQTR